MTISELLSVAVALLGVVVATAALIRTRIYHREIADLQRIQAQLQTDTLELQRKQTETAQRLAEYELAAYREAEAARNRADIRVGIVRTSGNIHRVVVANVGPGVAEQVNLEFDPSSDNESPLAYGEDAKLPFARLAPGEKRTLEIVFSNRSYPPYDIVVTWNDADGQERRLETSLDG